MKRGFKLNIVLVMAISIMFLFTVLAQTEGEHKGFKYENFDEFYDYIPSLNENIQSEEFELPDKVNLLIGEGNLLFNVTQEDSNKEFHATVEDKMIVGIFQGSAEEFNYVISASEETTNSIFNSEDKISAILSSYEEGDISLKAVGFGNKVKLFVAKVFVKFA